MKKTTLIPLVSISILLAITCVYVFLISFDENRTFSQRSIDYWILTPKVIKNHPLKDVSNQVYTYSVGEGNKPEISTFTFKSSLMHKQVISELGTYFVNEGFERINDYSFRRGKTLVDIEFGDFSNMKVVVQTDLY